MTSLAEDFLKDFGEDPEVVAANEPDEEELVEEPQDQCPASILNDEESMAFVRSLADKPQEKSLPFLQRVNNCLQRVDAEILKLFEESREIYSVRFPELEALLPMPLDYLFVMRKLGNALENVNDIDLSVQLSNQAILAVSVAASVSVGRSLEEDRLQQALTNAQTVDRLIEVRTALLEFIEQSMAIAAPNLTVIVGSSLAARLVAHAGGLKALADMPSQNLMVVGGSSYARRTAAITASTDPTLLPAMARQKGRGFGVIFECDLIQSTPAAYRARALRLVVGKAALAVRKDVYNNDGTSTTGAALRQYIIQKLQKAQTPAATVLRKPLPIPEEREKSRRGGRRKRRWKEKYGMTESRKKANRLLVTIDNPAEPESMDVTLPDIFDDEDDVF